MEGFPSTVKLDLRYYTDSFGRFTPRLREHYSPATAQRGKRKAYIKVGSCWMIVDYNLVLRGMVFRLMEEDGTFLSWEEDGSDLMFAMTDSFKNRDGVWTVQVRKPSDQEFADA